MIESATRSAVMVAVVRYHYFTRVCMKHMGLGMSFSVRGNKMKTAHNSAPIRCDCGRLLSKPSYWKTINHIGGMLHSVLENDTWYISCECWRVYIWSFPNVWKRSHILELGRTMEVIA